VTTALVLAPFGIALAVLALAGHLASRRSRVNAAAGGPAAPLQARRNERGAARPEIQAGDERQPFEADNGLIIGEAATP
jgi:hypothetical protein